MIFASNSAFYTYVCVSTKLSLVNRARFYHYIIENILLCIAVGIFIPNIRNMYTALFVLYLSGIMILALFALGFVAVHIYAIIVKTVGI